MARRRSQTEHDEMLEQVVELLQQRGYRNIMADLTGFTKPEKVVWESTGEGDFPDASAVKDNMFRIFEVETIDSINDEHTAEQWTLLASFADANEIMFYVVFPKGALDKVKSRLMELNIKARLWEV